MMPVANNINIYLIGLMGAGKTTIGRQLAKRLGRRFCDSDHEIMAKTGVGIPVVFEIEGELGFREREAQVIHELTSESGIVMATGGGAILNAVTRQRLRETGWVVYLDVPPATLYERTRLDRNRPLLRVADPLQRLQSLYQQRDSLYRETAHCVLEGTHSATGSAVDKILDEYEKRCGQSK